MELKDLLEAIGIKPEEGKELDLDTFKEQFGKTYVGREVAKQDKELIGHITGKALGSITTEAKRIFGFQNADVEGKKVEEILQMGIEKSQKQIEELKAAGASTDDTKVKKLQEEITIRDGKIKEFETLYNNQKSEFEGFKNQVVTEKKQSTISQHYKNHLSKIPFSQDVNEYTLKGFDAAIREKYKIDLNEEGTDIIFLAQDGTQVKNASGSQYESNVNILTAEADAAKILKKNNAGGSQGAAQQANAFPQSSAQQVQQSQKQVNVAGRANTSFVSR